MRHRWCHLLSAVDVSSFVCVKAENCHLGGMMKEGMEGVWKEVWRDPESAKLDCQPKPIRGFLRNPDFRSGRDPVTGREVCFILNYIYLKY